MGDTPREGSFALPAARDHNHYAKKTIQIAREMLPSQVAFFCRPAPLRFGRLDALVVFILTGTRAIVSSKKLR